MGEIESMRIRSLVPSSPPYSVTQRQNAPVCLHLTGARAKKKLRNPCHIIALSAKCQLPGSGATPPTILLPSIRR